jgi:hypothetical protein
MNGSAYLPDVIFSLLLSLSGPATIFEELFSFSPVFMKKKQ